MKRAIIATVFFLVTLWLTPSYSQVSPAFNTCKADCNKVKSGDLKFCMKKTGTDRDKCRQSAEKDYDACFAQCEKKYIKRK